MSGVRRPPAMKRGKLKNQGVLSHVFDPGRAQGRLTRCAEMTPDVANIEKL